ncbi:hypothetical protein ACHELX_002416 [Vibrio vulnificus]
MKLKAGYVTLLFTALLLLFSLVISLASARGLLYQIKIAQNEVKSRQEHWLAEGGLECVYTKTVQDGVIPTLSSIPECNIGSHSVTFTYEAVTAVNNPTKVTSKIGYAGLSKNIVSSSTASSSGALKSSANLFFNASMSFYTPDPGLETPDGFECAIIRHKGNITLRAAMDNKGLQDGRPPSSDFSSSKNCLMTHRSHWGNKDIVKDTNLKPFEEFFGVTEDKHNQVRSKFDYQISGGGADCGARIKDKLLAHKGANPGSKVSIWVDGSCELAEPYILEIAQESQKTDGLLLLVHEGVFSINSPWKEDKPTPDIKGLVFHFNDEFIASENDWNNMANKPNLFHSVHNFDLSERKKTSFYHHGSISFTGGFYIDDDRNNAMFNNSMGFHFNNDVISNLQSAFVSKLKWQEGSWNAN